MVEEQDKTEKPKKWTEKMAQAVDSIKETGKNLLYERRDSNKPSTPSHQDFEDLKNLRQSRAVN